MTLSKLNESRHFTLEQLVEGVYACIHKPGGAAYSNAGIIDLGDRTIVVDAFDTIAAGRDLRQTAEALFQRPVEIILLTHPHSDHWIGASAFAPSTRLVASKITLRVSQEWGAEIVEDYKKPGEWDHYIKELEDKLEFERDERIRVGLENELLRIRYVRAELGDFQPRYAGQTFEKNLHLHGDLRAVELRSLGRGHSEDDAVLYLSQDGIAFIGDIGFFDTQPFLGFCDLPRYRKQMLLFRDSGYKILVPGHGPIGDQQDIALQLDYLDTMEDLVGRAVQRGESLERTLQFKLPEPFDRWLIGGMGRFQANVRYLYQHLGGKPNQKS